MTILYPSIWPIIPVPKPRVTMLVEQGSTADSSKKSPAAPTGPPLGDPSWDLGLHQLQHNRHPLLPSACGRLTRSAGRRIGGTASQLQDLLRTSSPARELLSESLKSFTASNGTSFRVDTSSALFSKEAPPVSQAFVKDSQAKFSLQHQPLGKGDSKADQKQMRDWAEAGLGGREGAPSTPELQAKAGALILANALSFKGLWAREFSEDSTDHRTFFGKKYTKVKMMHRTGLYHYHEDMENMVQVLVAPLWGGKASVVLLLPFHLESLARLDKLLTIELLSKWLEKTSITTVSISIPKANITSTLSLQKQLSALGLTDAWDAKPADFSGVSDKSKGKLHLGAVLQWASLELTGQAGKGDAELDEENVDKPKLFCADHPFVVLVRDSVTGALVLIGALDHADGEALHDEL
uniref:Serpin domain-containing protein n=1 Tax=Mola mola TaxID=94237 RepID=A0A3Q3WTL2_MOLML